MILSEKERRRNRVQIEVKETSLAVGWPNSTLNKFIFISFVTDAKQDDGENSDFD